MAGLPESVVAGAATEAKANGMDGRWLFTLQDSSRTPFLQYAQNRELRKKIYLAYTNMGNNGDSNDNKEVLKQIPLLANENLNL